MLIYCIVTQSIEKNIPIWCSKYDKLFFHPLFFSRALRLVTKISQLLRLYNQKKKNTV